MYFILSIDNKLVYNIVFSYNSMTKVPRSRSLSSLAEVLPGAVVKSCLLRCNKHPPPPSGCSFDKTYSSLCFHTKTVTRKAENIILKSKKSLKLSRLKSEAIEILKCIIPTLYTTNFKPCHS